MRPSDPRLRQYLRPATRPLAAVVVLGVVGSVLILLQAWALTGLIVSVLQRGPVVTWAAVTLAVFAGRGVVSLVGEVCASRAAGVVGTDLRRRLTRTVIGNARRHAREGSSGQLSVLLTRGVSAAEPYLTRYVPALVLAAVLPPLTVVTIATQDVLSAVIIVVTLPLVPVFGALVGLATRDRAEEQWRAMASLSGHFLDVVRGLPTLVAHRRARAQSDTIAQVTDRYRVATLGTLRLAFASAAVLELVATLSVALVAVTVGVRLAAGGLDLETALFVLLLAPEAYWPLRRVGAEFHAAAEGVATFESADGLLAAEPEDRHAARPLEAVPGATSSTRRGTLLAHDLTVRHPGRTVPALSLVRFELPAHGVTVVTGPSGCGKSTLLETVAGLIEPTGGHLTWAGLPVSDLRWRRQVAWLPQRPHFVAGSIGDNLRLGAHEADDASCWTALRSVALEERVRALPEGLDTPLGEDGQTLSAGERARLALARILVADRAWNLLDEPTAHVDALTEQVMVDAIAELGRRASVIVVSHRPALLEVADHLITLPAAPATPLPDPPEPARGMTAAPTSAKPASSATDDPHAPFEAPDGPQDGPRFARATVLGSLASASGVALTATAGWLIVQASTHPPVLTMLVAIVGVRAFGLARPVLRYVERLWSHDAALRLLARRRVQVYNALIPLTPARLGRRRGDLLAAVVDDVDSVVDRELRVRQPALAYAMVVALAAAVAAIVAPALALIIGTGAATAGAAGYWAARVGSSRWESRSIAQRSDLSALVVETVQAADELDAWQANDHAAGRVADQSSALAHSALRASASVAVGRLVVLLLTGATIAATAVACTRLVSEGTLSGPSMALLVLLPLALGELAAQLPDAGMFDVRTRAAGERLRHLERTAPAVRDTVAETRTGDSSAVEVDGARGRWSATAPVTAPVSVLLEPGDRVAVVGPSGSGKSTMAALLMRFLDPVEGRVCLGGVPLDRLSLDDVRRSVGIVDDDPHVFATTVVENVRFARPGATDDDVLAALVSARLGAWVASLPDGLHTWVGDGHGAVSGGERARLAVARSLLAGHRVLVLDEPTAHLDHATAAELALEVLTGPREQSVVWITHAPAGLDLVDRVVSLTGHDLAATTSP
jgi:ATP-binding cassette subfamily C protein CydCD